MSHEGAISRVRDAHGYDVGYAARCGTCDGSGDLRERPGQAMPDLLAHLNDRPTESPT